MKSTVAMGLLSVLVTEVPRRRFGWVKFAVASLLFYLVLGGLVNHYVFPEPEPDAALFPKTGETISSEMAGAVWTVRSRGKRNVGVKGDELQRAREYWEVELTAKHQRLIPSLPGSARPDGDGKLVREG